MLRISLLLFPLLVLVVHGEDGPFPQIEEVESKLKELEQTPVAVEFQAFSKTLNQIWQEKSKQAEELQKKVEILRQTEAFQKYARKRKELESQRDRAWMVERKKLTESVEKIYTARHEELKSAAKMELSAVKQLGLDVLTYPRVDGSTSSEPLSIVIACRVLDVPYAWVYPEPKGHPWRNQFPMPEFFLPHAKGAQLSRDFEFLLATLRVFAKPARKEQERIAIMINSLLAVASSTHASYVNLIEGKSDLNLAARPPSESELKLAKEKGVTIKLEPVARDAFVFIVNQKNSVKGLTRSQIREIYEEKITDWKTLGGAEGKICAYRRERDSGSRELFDALVMEGQSLPEDKRFRDLYANSMGGPFSQITQEAAGLGYSIYYYEHFMSASPHTRMLAIDGVEPTAESIASGKYPWATRVYAAYRDGEAKDRPGMKLLNWLLSPEGQAVVRESGYVPEK
jgi:ABC-type phosphate transport system substrate-binding protein